MTARLMAAIARIDDALFSVRLDPLDVTLIAVTAASSMGLFWIGINALAGRFPVGM
jgi:hypothetical protein